MTIPGFAAKAFGFFLKPISCESNERSCRTIIIANNIQLLSKEAIPKFDSSDVKTIKKISKRHDVSHLIRKNVSYNNVNEIRPVRASNSNECN